MDDQENKFVSWYELPFCRALSEKAMFMGAPREVIILNFMIGGIFIMDFGFYPIIAFCFAIHWLATSLSKSDSQFFEALIVYMRQKKYYVP